MQINKVLVGALQQCDTKELLEDTFSRFNLSDCLHKTEHLVEAMGNPTLFFSEGTIDMESRYSTVLSMFLTGEWKMNKLYERSMLIKLEQLLCDYLWEKEFYTDFNNLHQLINRLDVKLNNNASPSPSPLP